MIMRVKVAEMSRVFGVMFSVKIYDYVQIYDGENNIRLQTKHSNNEQKHTQIY